MKFHCSVCGCELVHVRKAIPGKGKIVDLIEPHECCGHAYKAGEDERPTVLDIINSLKPIGPVVSVGNEGDEDGRYNEPGDLREDGKGSKSSAPRSLLKSMENLPSIGGEKGSD
jgi:hypothetical protein